MSDLLKLWAATLDRLRFELNRNIAAANVLSSEQREALLSIFCDQLVVEQHKFIQQAQSVGFTPGTDVVRTSINVENLVPAAELILSVSAGVAAATTAIAWIVSTDSKTTGMWFWAKTETTQINFTKTIATRFSISETLVVSLIFILIAYLSFKVIRSLSCGIQRKLIRRHILKNYDSNMRPQLLRWAQNVLENSPQ